MSDPCKNSSQTVTISSAITFVGVPGLRCSFVGFRETWAVSRATLAYRIMLADEELLLLKLSPVESGLSKSSLHRQSNFSLPDAENSATAPITSQNSSLIFFMWSEWVEATKAMPFLKQKHCLSYTLQGKYFFLSFNLVSLYPAEKHKLSTKERTYPLRRILDDALNNVKLCFYLINLHKTPIFFEVLKWLPGVSVPRAATWRMCRILCILQEGRESVSLSERCHCIYKMVCTKGESNWNLQPVHSVTVCFN